MAVGLAGHLDIEITFVEREKRSHGADFAYLGHRVSGEQAAGVDPAHRTQIGERGDVAGIDALPVGGNVAREEVRGIHIAGTHHCGAVEGPGAPRERNQDGQKRHHPPHAPNLPSPSRSRRQDLGFWPYSWACYSVRVQRVLLLGSRDGV